MQSQSALERGCKWLLVHLGLIQLLFFLSLIHYGCSSRSISWLWDYIPLLHAPIIQLDSPLGVRSHRQPPLGIKVSPPALSGHVIWPQASPRKLSSLPPPASSGNVASVSSQASSRHVSSLQPLNITIHSDKKEKEGCPIPMKKSKVVPRINLLKLARPREILSVVWGRQPWNDGGNPTHTEWNTARRTRLVEESSRVQFFGSEHWKKFRESPSIGKANRRWVHSVSEGRHKPTQAKL